MDDDTSIRKLDRRTVERIAAGEVVERPASAVKELVENALDAGAGRIEVAVDGDGTDRIAVRDDGHGMTEADVRAAVKEHTTSKIDDVSDLESGVATLGFRGEALHTIGAVSRTTITTKPPDADRGTRLRYEGGETVAVDPAGRPVGTTVEVEDLFYNTPARRKFLKREATEFAHVNRVVSRYALANPGVAVTLEHDGRETFSTAGQGSLRAAILSVYGREVAEAMLPVVAGDPPEVATDLPDPDGDADLPEGPLTGIAGYVSHPETTRSNADYVSTFVNGRYVDAAAVREAVLAAYGGQLAGDRYPFAVVHLSVPADAVDVNVHPRKMKVRFDDEEGIRDQVRGAVRKALLDHGLERSSAPRGRSAPEETPVSPDPSGGDPDPDSGADPDRTSGSAPGTAPTSGPGPDSEPTGSGTDADGRAGAPAGSYEKDDGAVPGEDDDTVPGGSGDADASDRDPRPGRGPDRGGPPGGDSGATADSRSGSGSGDRPAGGTGVDRSDPGASESHRSDPGTSGVERTDDPGAGEGGAADDPEAGDVGRTDDPGAGEGGSADDPARKFPAPTEQHTLDGDRADPDREYDSLPRLTVLGQYDGTYLVAETPSGLALIDQHAADERVNYERLRSAFEGGTTAQRLAAPVELAVTAGEAATFEAAREALAELGFEADLVAGDDGSEAGEGDDDRKRLRVRSVPAVFDETVDPERIREVLSSFVGGDPAGAVDDLADRFLADLACYPSITGNTSLTEGSVTELLERLDDCENPYACPHGRPVVVELDRSEIEARFERDYPGHGG